jgi:apolipoprotein D and lipocalin family protein
VSLPIKVAGQTLFNNPAPYNVIATDYDNYSLVYSCTNLPLGYKYEIYWILGRAKSLDDTLIQSLKAELKNQGADLNELIKVDQSC